MDHGRPRSESTSSRSVDNWQSEIQIELLFVNFSATAAHPGFFCDNPTSVVMCLVTMVASGDLYGVPQCKCHFGEERRDCGQISDDNNNNNNSAETENAVGQTVHVAKRVEYRFVYFFLLRSMRLVGWVTNDGRYFFLWIDNLVSVRVYNSSRYRGMN